MNRGEVYRANLNPTEGSEQSGPGSVIIVSRNAINDNSPKVLIVPCATDRGQRIYPGPVSISAREGSTRQNSIAMAVKVRAIDKARLN